jgi:hypothetical protein
MIRTIKKIKKQNKKIIEFVLINKIEIPNMNITSIKKFIKDIKKEFKLSTSDVTFCRKLSEEFLTNNLYS